VSAVEAGTHGWDLCVLSGGKVYRFLSAGSRDEFVLYAVQSAIIMAEKPGRVAGRSRKRNFDTGALSLCTKGMRIEAERCVPSKPSFTGLQSREPDACRSWCRIGDGVQGARMLDGCRRYSTAPSRTVRYTVARKQVLGHPSDG